jgi:hypothetical protein
MRLAEKILADQSSFRFRAHKNPGIGHGDGQATLAGKRSLLCRINVIGRVKVNVLKSRGIPQRRKNV